MNELIDKKIGNELDGGIISEVFEGYTFKITGGYDKDGFAMKNGVLTQGKKRILLHKGLSMFRFRKGYTRSGSRERRLVRGCIVSPDIKVLHLKVVKRGPKPIPGLTDEGCEVPKRLGPKRATKILKTLGLTAIYAEKKKNKEERKTLRLMFTKLAPKREVTTKNGKKIIKQAKIQRLITPTRLLRKKELKDIRKQRREMTKNLKESYKKAVKETFGKKVKKDNKKK